MKSFFITGAAGFIGSHVCEHILIKFPNAKIFALDKLTYAGNKIFLKKLFKSKKFKFIHSDILNTKKYFKYLKNIDCAINIAAESHVDHSFKNSIEFTRTNTLGAHVFLENCIRRKVNKIIHISTDEVYGDKIKGFSYETDSLNPTNPYSASKAAAEMITNSYKFVLKKDIIIVRANNIYGTRQFPEKLIPSCIVSLIKNKKIPIHGNGRHLRHYLYVKDFCNALEIIVKKVNKGIYNVGSTDSYRNIKIAKKICSLMNKSYKNIKFTKDRPFNDRRYAVSSKKIHKLGWRQKAKLFNQLEEIINWYKEKYNVFNSKKF
jgi:dTDP-glucose 4,6-dehydratase